VSTGPPCCGPLPVHRAPGYRVSGLRARRALGRVCRPQDFWFINTCEVLRQHFPCEKGCTVELGSDVPAYVHQQGLPTSQACLVTQQQPQCWGEHAATSRLCACSRA
jgi:hypothetical protein